eukprot:CAMPEP_0201939030 /NCGR_PEP_ID=MMETSP0903-20130614/42395_1 /ASSEMBLY_ACC=CAM_ASM_000552 /TAXON_ID=420261 /ORGANISM="Thalassiosira antarctica, Strain CCMP982" /LENGTH=540 /DNA_ID=CAMNT_0048480437 /DNA_START=26 /DNA_END=1645 /DNA_ORIENTATION=+
MAPFKKKGESNNLEKSTSSSAKPSEADDFSARRSSRVAAGRYTADNDTWVEALAVCEVPVKPGYGDDKAAAASKKSGSGGGLFRKFKSKNNVTEKEVADETKINTNNKSPGEADVAAASQRLTLRPYFQSQNTRQRVWDEPPSGASNIMYATPEARKMAQAQLEEMKSTYAHAAVKRRQEREEEKAMKAALGESKPSGGSGKLIPKVFKRSTSASAVDEGQSSSLLGNHSKSGSRRTKGTLVLSDEGGRRGIPKSVIQESKELAGVMESKNSYEEDLQKAMLMSMGIGGGSVMGVGDNKPRSRSSSKSPHMTTTSSTTNGLTREEEEQLAMATALSLSEQEARQGRSTRRSKSSSYRRGESKDSNGSGGSAKQRSRSHNKYPPSHNSSSSSHTNYANTTASMEPNLSDFDDNFDGGRKIPPARSRSKTSKSSSYRRGESKDSYGSGGSIEPRSRSHNGHPPPHNKSSSSHISNYDTTANRKPTLSEFDENFDGGGKMPAARSKIKNSDNNRPNIGDDFGDRGPSWELSWSHSASPTNKDW